jgi:hypothetical protein
VILDFYRRGKPTDNATIESFNGRFGDECLNAHWFAPIEDAQQIPIAPPLCHSGPGGVAGEQYTSADADHAGHLTALDHPVDGVPADFHVA